MPSLLDPLGWKLPKGSIPTVDMPQEDLAKEAKESRPLLREFGMKDAAIAHPDLLNQQYLRTVQYLGRMSVRPYMIQIITMLGSAATMGLMFYMFGPEQEATSSLEGMNKGMIGIIGAIMGFVFGFGAGYSARCISQFWVAYAISRVAQKVVDPSGQRRTVAVYELPLLRMAFADRPSERFFSGIEKKSGFASGRINLETEVNLATITDPRMLYNSGIVKPCESSFTGVNTSRRHSLNEMAKNAGRINAQKQMMRERKDDWRGWIGENKGFTFLLVSAGVSMLVLMIGVDIDLSQATKLFG